MKNYYQITDFLKFAEKDEYQNGCNPDTSISFNVEYLIQSESLDDVIEKAMSFLGVDDHQNVLLNSCDELGRIDIQVLENIDGIPASKHEIDLWKENKCELWACTYSAQITFIYENDDLDLINLVKNKTQFST